jgi:hypothetical protein
MTTIGSDRALQDALIRLLADAPFREAIQRLGDGEGYDGVPAEQIAVLRTAHAEQIRRFSRFLARQYYHERIAHFHRYSRALARWTHRRPEEVLRSPGFDELLPTLILGSREAARAIADLLQTHLRTPNAPPYAAELVRYQNVQLVVEAGPRTWRSDEPPVALSTQSTPALHEHACVVDFEWDLPALFPVLLAAARETAPTPEPPPAQRARLTLLFARTPRGRVSVLRCTPAVLDFLSRLGGTSTVATAAAAAGIEPGEALQIANELAGVGALIERCTPPCSITAPAVSSAPPDRPASL